MKKTIRRTTKEYKYNERDILVKEVETIEEYEVEVATSEILKANAITSDKASTTKIDSVTPYRKAQGIPPYKTSEPYEAKFGTGGAGKLTYNGKDVTLPQDTINGIVSQVKAKLEAELKSDIRTMPYRPNKAF